MPSYQTFLLFKHLFESFTIFSDGMWAGVLFFLFCVGMVFYVFEHINIWITKNYGNVLSADNNKIGDAPKTITIDIKENAFLSSKFVFKKVI